MPRPALVDAMQPPPDNLVQSLGRRHRRLDSQATNVLPALLQQRHQIIDSQHDVRDQLILSHTDIAHSDTHAQHLLELELNRALDLVDLVVQVFGVRDWGWEFTGFGETGAEKTRDLLDEGVGGNEGIVFAGELLDEFLVLVELLQVVAGHGVDTEVFGSIDVVLVTEDASKC